MRCEIHEDTCTVLPVLEERISKITPNRVSSASNIPLCEEKFVVFFFVQRCTSTPPRQKCLLHPFDTTNKPTQHQVRKRGKDKKYQAVRLAVGEECDLAVLTIEDEDFWKDISPITFGELPELTDNVNVIG